ncbi:hypothetical protein STEG23_023642 [Scotinomys teguina]
MMGRGRQSQGSGARQRGVTSETQRKQHVGDTDNRYPELCHPKSDGPTDNRDPELCHPKSDGPTDNRDPDPPEPSAVARSQNWLNKNPYVLINQSDGERHMKKKQAPREPGPSSDPQKHKFNAGKVYQASSNSYCQDDSHQL